MPGFLKLMGALLAAGGIGWALFCATAAKSLAYGGLADQIAMMWIYAGGAAGLVAGLAAAAGLFALAAILERLEAISAATASGPSTPITGPITAPRATPHLETRAR